jgi:hypothetical protein
MRVPPPGFVPEWTFESLKNLRGQFNTSLNATVRLFREL